jgi:hypothetical protein
MADDARFTVDFQDGGTAGGSAMSALLAGVLGHSLDRCGGVPSRLDYVARDAVAKSVREAAKFLAGLLWPSKPLVLENFQLPFSQLAQSHASNSEVF